MSPCSTRLDSEHVNGTRFATAGADDDATIGELREVVDSSLRHAVRPSTLATYRHQWTALLRHVPADTTLQSLTRDRLQRVVNDLVESGYRPATVHNIVATLRRYLGRALEDGLIARDPLVHVALPRVSSRPPRYLDRSQRVRLLAVAERAGRDPHLVVALGAYAGLRKAEMLALCWEQVDLVKRLILVQNTDAFTTKSGRSRVIPIGDELLRILERHRPPDATGHVLAPARRSRRRYRWDFRRTFAKVAAEADVPWLTVHGLRHTYATALAQAGVSLFKIRTWLGHSSLSTTEIYAHAAEVFDPDVNRAC